MVTTFVKRNRKSQQEEFTPHEAYVVEVFITSMFIDSPVNLIKNSIHYYLKVLDLLNLENKQELNLLV